MEKAGKERPLGEKSIVTGISRYLNGIDDIILVIVALGIIITAVFLLIEAVSDFIYIKEPEHSVAHIISDLMFVLIIMELFRQVVRQIMRHAFSLNPFLFIGVIASIRGMLITQMKLSMGEVDWQAGIWQLSVHALIVVFMTIAYYLYAKAAPSS